MSDRKIFVNFSFFFPSISYFVNKQPIQTILSSIVSAKNAEVKKIGYLLIQYVHIKYIVDSFWEYCILLSYIISFPVGPMVFSI